MQLNLDSAIFVGFLVLTLVLGLASSRGITTIKEYAVGDRNFSTATIAATIVATWITGEVFFTTVSETYTNGMYFILAATGDVVGLLVIGIFLAPRMSEFLGKLSIAEAMGDLFGKRIRIITALAGCIGTIGIIAVQLKVSGLLFEYCFNLPSAYGVIIGGVIITLYSALGGIKSVTLTDVIQFFTFGTIIPSIAFFILGTLDNGSAIMNTLSNNPLFDYRQVFDFSLPKSQYFLFLFLFFASVLGVNPAIFQRISMSKNTEQVSKSFIIAAISYTLIIVAVIWIGILLLSVKPDIAPQNLVKHILFDYSFTGLKGLTLVGIMAMVMSTADSYINTTSILFVHDFCKPLGIKIMNEELKSSRIVSFTVGVLSLCLSLSSENLLNLIIATNVLYLPLVIAPFLLATLGFRSSAKSVLISMGAGFCCLIAGIILAIDILQSAVLGMLANSIFLIGSHYILKQPGGWVGIKNIESLKQIRQQRKIRQQKFISSILNLNLKTLFQKNSPNTEASYVYFGLFCIISLYSNMYTIPKEVKIYYVTLINFISPSVLFSATSLLSYPLWPSTWKEKTLISIVWNFVAFYVLICIGFLFVIISKFAPLQVMILILNLILIAITVRWQWALIMMLTGFFIITQFLKFYLEYNALQENALSLQLKVIYLLLLLSSILIAFLKPKQEYQELTEEKVDHLRGRIGNQEKEMQAAWSLRGEFIRNISHEYHAPMVGISSLADVLFEAYDKMNDSERKAAIKNILESSVKLEVFDSNISSLSKLAKANYQLNLESIDLSYLVYERVETCRKLYEGDKEAREFIFDIDDNIEIKGDKYYLTQLLDNLIINAITYCKKGKIIIALKKNSTEIEFAISDEGIGIPKEELYGIFAEFTVSSKTKTLAGGRGIGLTLAKRVVEVHGGSIKAESDGIKGARVSFILPLTS